MLIAVLIVLFLSGCGDDNGEGDGGQDDVKGDTIDVVSDGDIVDVIPDGDIKDTQQDTEPQLPHFRNVILISWDGTRRDLLEQLMNHGRVTNVPQLISEGSMTEVYFPPALKYDPQTDEITFIEDLSQIREEDIIYKETAVTDPGHARMLTGKWNIYTGICEPTDDPRIDYACNNCYNTVNDGMTIMEIIKERTDDILTGVVTSRNSDIRELKDSYETIVGVFKKGDDIIYIPVKIQIEGIEDPIAAIGGHGFYSTTFANAQDSLDYYFGDDVINSLEDEKDNAYINLYDSRELEHLIHIGELKAEYVAIKLMDFINQIGSENRFFFFVHFCEPDLFGHFYGGDSSEYLEAIVRDDQALGIIIDGLRNISGYQESTLYDETLIIVTTDHGTNGEQRPPQIIEIGDRKWLKGLAPLHGNVDIYNHLIWMANNKLKDLPQRIYQVDIVPLILQVLGIE